MYPDQERRRRFEALTEQIYEPVYRYLRRRMPIHDAEEVVNDVLVTIWRRLDDVPEPNALPWAYGVARRATANHRRGDTRRLALVNRIEAEPMAVINPEPQDHPVLEAAINELTSSEQEIVRLWAWEGLEPREIAAVLDTNANAVSIKLTRIKAKISKEMRKNPSIAGHNRIETTGDRP